MDIQKKLLRVANILDRFASQLVNVHDYHDPDKFETRSRRAKSGQGLCGICGNPVNIGPSTKWAAYHYPNGQLHIGRAPDRSKDFFGWWPLGPECARKPDVRPVAVVGMPSSDIAKGALVE